MPPSGSDAAANIIVRMLGTLVTFLLCCCLQISAAVSALTNLHNLVIDRLGAVDNEGQGLRKETCQYGMNIFRPPMQSPPTFFLATALVARRPMTGAMSANCPGKRARQAHRCGHDCGWALMLSPKQDKPAL